MKSLVASRSRYAVLLALTVPLALAGCASAIPFVGDEADLEPPAYGLYAVEDGELQRLDGPEAWERATWSRRADFDTDVEFVVSDLSLAANSTRLEEAIRLYRVARVRNIVHADGRVVPVSEDEWQEPNIPDFSVPLDFAPLGEGRDAVRVRPVDPLSPGLYSLRLKASEARRAGRLGVDWQDVDRERYAARNCVDRHLGSEVYYRPCSDELPAGTGLSVHLVQPRRQMGDGGNRLVVEGVVVNASERTQPVPKLQGSLRDEGGETLSRWTFDTDVEELSPGASVSFRTETAASPEAVGVRVDFLPSRQSSRR